jgi:hypothetical protein
MKPSTPLVILATALAPSVAGADLHDRIAGYGLNVSAGGGLVQFVDQDMRGFAREGTGWEARIGLGTRTLFAVEAAYVGSLHAIDALGLDASANLLGTGFEANARLNMREGAVQPYVLAGVGWSHYRLVDSDVNTSAVANSDDVAMLPFGAGVTFRRGALTLDARAVYRATTAVDMFAGASEGTLATWSGTLRVGLEY